MVGKPACFRHRREELSGFSRHSLTSYSVLCLILGLVLEASPASALDSTSSFAEYAATTWTTASVEDGSREVVRVALLGPDGPTGTFTRWENTTIPW